MDLKNIKKEIKRILSDTYGKVYINHVMPQQDGTYHAEYKIVNMGFGRARFIVIDGEVVKF